MQPPGNDEVCILGTLPADCEKLLREDGEGEWVVTLDGVSVAGGLSSSNKHAESTSGQLVIAADARLRFSSARRGHVWEAQVAPVVDGDHPVEGRLVMDGVVEHLSLQRSVCIKEDTWKQHSSVVAPPAPTVAKTDSPKAAVEASSSAPADASATLPACMEQLALFLAPAPRSGPQLLKHLQQCRREDVVAAIQRLTAPPRGSTGKGARDLNVEGFVLLNIEAFASSEERRKVADRAFNALISAFQSSQGPAPPRTKSVYLEKLHAMEPYADRDLILAAHRGAGGGIMAGLRTTTAKRSREATNSGDDDDDVSHEGSGSDEDQRGDAQRLTAAQFMDMSQCDVRWEDGDLRTPARMMCEDGSQVAVLDAAKAAVPAPVDDDDGRVGLEAMPITTGEQLRNAQHRYTHLLQILHSLEDVVQKHKVITSRGIEWCLRHEKRMSPALREQLRSWWEEQKAPRLEYAQWRQYVHDAAYELERDIADFVQLHDYGIV